MHSAIERIEKALAHIDQALEAGPAMPPVAPVAEPAVDREKIVGALRALDALIVELKAAPHA